MDFLLYPAYLISNHPIAFGLLGTFLFYSAHFCYTKAHKYAHLVKTISVLYFFARKSSRVNTDCAEMDFPMPFERCRSKKSRKLTVPKQPVPDIVADDCYSHTRDLIPISVVGVANVLKPNQREMLLFQTALGCFSTTPDIFSKAETSHLLTSPEVDIEAHVTLLLYTDAVQRSAINFYTRFLDPNVAFLPNRKEEILSRRPGCIASLCFAETIVNAADILVTLLTFTDKSPEIMSTFTRIFENKRRTWFLSKILLERQFNFTPGDGSAIDCILEDFLASELCHLDVVYTNLIDEQSLLELAAYIRVCFTSGPFSKNISFVE
jgi:hypothetical protein